MAESMHPQLQRYNQLIRENDGIYRRMAAVFGLAELDMWILYALREAEQLPLSELTAMLHQSRQSVHSAVKKMEQQGYLQLLFEAGSRKNKTVSLTEQGYNLAQCTVDKLLAAEEAALAVFSAAEIEQYLQILERYTRELAARCAEVEDRGDYGDSAF